MSSLRECYNDLTKDTNRWSYYNNAPSLTVDIMKSNNMSFTFIKDYFKCGGKEEVFQPLQIKSNETELEERAPHIISTYLLGILIADSLGIDLQTRDSKNINFKYLWFLACLYHDIGYVYENIHNCKYLRMIQADGLDAIREVCDIKYLHEREFITYKREHVNTYLTNRAACTHGKVGKIDHGIAGGLMLYDQLRKNYERVWKKVSRYNANVSRKYFEYKGLYFSNSHYEYYAEAADAIIAHNIWLSTLNKYLKNEKKTKLREQIINKSNPTAFILSLADSLEPIKRGKFEILDRISFEQIRNGFAFSMPIFIYENIYGKISDLKTWVVIDIIEEKGQGRFSIVTKE